MSHTQKLSDKGNLIIQKENKERTHERNISIDLQQKLLRNSIFPGRILQIMLNFKHIEYNA